MASATTLTKGQALIELIFCIILIIVTVAMSAGVALKLRSQFKHDFLPLDQSAQTDKLFLKTEDTIIFKKDLILFDSHNKENQADEIATRGWQERAASPHLKKIKIFEKEGSELLLIKNLGVITCLKNCN